MTHVSASYRRLRRWQYGLILFVTLGILATSLLFYRRALFFTAFVPIGFAPFSYARLRLHAALEQVLGSSSGLFRSTVWLGLACDLILAAQFLTGRWSDELPLLHAPGVAWVGAIWYSAYLFLFFGYMGLDLWALGLRGLKRLVRAAEPARTAWSRPSAVAFFARPAHWAWPHRSCSRRQGSRPRTICSSKSAS